MIGRTEGGTVPGCKRQPEMKVVRGNGFTCLAMTMTPGEWLPYVRCRDTMPGADPDPMENSGSGFWGFNEVEV